MARASRATPQAEAVRWDYRHGYVTRKGRGRFEAYAYTGASLGSYPSLRQAALQVGGKADDRW